MIQINIPGQQQLSLSHLVLDYNGTIALDGEVIDGVIEELRKLSLKLKIHIITADTHGTVAGKTNEIEASLHIIGANNQDEEKLHYIQNLGVDNVVAVGNGRNDILMLKSACLGIAIIQTEGACSKLLLHADVISSNILDALGLLTKKERIIATLRN